MRQRLEIVVPVHNEQLVLAASVRRLHEHARAALPELDVRITIADNASSDLTGALAMQLASELPGVGLLQLPEKGRGRALRTAWSASNADVVAYMDVDLSTDLAGLAPLVRPLLTGEADLAIGTRLAPGSKVERSLKRELISRGYNRLLRSLLGVRFSDAQCGFKAARRAALLPVLHRVENQTWFFDTELLYIAERDGLAFFELPVHWVEDRDSSVRLVATAVEDLRGIARLRGGLFTRAVAPAAVPATPRNRDHQEAGVGTTPG
ncbi:MAG TPA: glycosyltransferase [Solirubrobacteraceae bacterium]|jgi:glycosyltransferase involved in cell wall biosynthesis|nr:glycosyltransferase [Solirubrobacteraceae bacterium]